MPHSSAIQRTARVAWLVAPLVLLALPTRWLDAAPSLCAIRRITGRPCLGCGMTRALSRLARGDPRGAWQRNPRVVVVAPLLVGVWLSALVDAFPLPAPLVRRKAPAPEPTSAHQRQPPSPQTDTPLSRWKRGQGVRFSVSVCSRLPAAAARSAGCRRCGSSGCRSGCRAARWPGTPELCRRRQ